MNELTKRTHLAKCTARLAKCAAHLAKCAARLPKCAARLVNPTNSGQMRTQLNARAFGQLRCEFGQIYSELDHTCKPFVH